MELIYKEGYKLSDVDFTGTVSMGEAPFDIDCGAPQAAELAP